MTSDDVTKTLSARKATVAAQRSDLAANQRPPSALRAGVGLPFLIGTPVFDVVTGKEGTVVAGAPYTSKGGARVDVQLPDGSIVARLPRDVKARPTPPAPRAGG
ncbi:MAG: hypothetical protein ACRD1V_17925 [Vicinamibacterales bacterium]